MTIERKTAHGVVLRHRDAETILMSIADEDGPVTGGTYDRARLEQIAGGSPLLYTEAYRDAAREGLRMLDQSRLLAAAIKARDLSQEALTLWRTLTPLEVRMQEEGDDLRAVLTLALGEVKRAYETLAAAAGNLTRALPGDPR